MIERDWTVMTEAEVDLAVLRGEVRGEQEDRMDARADALARARRAINDLADLGGSCPYESEHDELSEEIRQRDELIAILSCSVGRGAWMQLATHQKELFADIVDRFYDHVKPVDRWWRNDD